LRGVCAVLCLGQNHSRHDPPLRFAISACVGQVTRHPLSPRTMAQRPEDMNAAALEAAIKAAEDAVPALLTATDDPNALLPVLSQPWSTKCMEQAKAAESARPQPERADAAMSGVQLPLLRQEDVVQCSSCKRMLLRAAMDKHKVSTRSGISPCVHSVPHHSLTERPSTSWVHRPCAPPSRLLIFSRRMPLSPNLRVGQTQSPRLVMSRSDLRLAAPGAAAPPVRPSRPDTTACLALLRTSPRCRESVHTAALQAISTRALPSP
jgi:hypothetical protein